MADKIDVQEARVAATDALATSPLGTPIEVAEFMRTTVSALAQDRYLGRGIPYVKHGRKILYRWADVRAHLDAHTVNPGAA